ncbi:interferon-induced protein 44-like [Scyliorhinus torazame]|uniref:interferon-induced protein 44-like n=1 Tax=Scyliorhinus torazame TaxID=75743 RepID=UPI003B5912A2
MIPSIWFTIKPHELSDMGVREIKENNLVEDSSWGEESTDSEFSSNNKAEHLDKHLSKQKYPHTSYSRHHVVHRLSIDQSALETLRSHLCMYKPPEKCVDCTNILLFGMVGAGKSSTINTFLSALDPDRRTMNCAPTGQHPDSLTVKLTSYKSNSLKFWDTAGWNSLDDPVKTKKVFRMILEGRVPLGTNLKNFNPDADDARNVVIQENVIHGVAFIFNTFTMDNIDLDLLKQFQDLQNIVAQKYIYKIVIGTNFDRLRIPAKSYNHIYENAKLKRKFAKLSDYIGMKKRTMFVISNEWKGYKIEKTKCVLALYILKNMVRNIDPGQDSSSGNAIGRRIGFDAEIVAGASFTPNRNSLLPQQRHSRTHIQ